MRNNSLLLPVILALVLAAPVLAPLASPARAQGGAWPEIALREVAGDLSMPVHVTHAGDGSGRLFVVEQEGRIRIIAGGRLLERPFLDIAGRVRTSYEEGLLSVAFPPGYANEGHFYVYYTNLDGNNLVARFHVSSADPNVADPASEEPVIEFPHPTYGNHNGGQLAFGPNDGYLYAGTGDGGGGGDPLKNAQDGRSLLGKILRIDVETADGRYVSPPDNPFVATTGFRDEIWALGVRNPWRFSFDRLTGDLYIGDVGQGNREEIDFQPASSAGGENYGWDILEGSECFEPSDGCEPPPNYSAPVAEYGRDLGSTVTGGFVYRGATYPRMQGIYFYADYGTGRIWGLRRDGGNWLSQELDDTDLDISTFGEDEAGELYLADIGGGKVYRITDPAVVATPTATTTRASSPSATRTTTATPAATVTREATPAGLRLYLPLIRR